MGVGVVFSCCSERCLDRLGLVVFSHYLPCDVGGGSRITPCGRHKMQLHHSTEGFAEVVGDV